MTKTTDIKKMPFYICPNGCKGTTFYQDGTVEITRHFSKEGEKLESDDDYGFSSKSVMKCRKCDADAIEKLKTITIITTIK